MIKVDEIFDKRGECWPKLNPDLHEGCTNSTTLNSTKKRHYSVLIVSVCCILSLLLLFLLYQGYPRFSLLESNIKSSFFSQEIATCPGHSTSLIFDESPISQEESHINRHAIILDAGSQGTRMHIYELEFCNDLLIAVHKDFFSSVSISLSSLAGTPNSFIIGAKIIDPLLSKALQLIPVSEHSYTPVALRATAGLRLLSSRQIDALLIGAKKALSKYPFMLVDASSKNNQSSVELIPGTSEGIWAWVSINFLYKNLNKDCLCSTKGIINSENIKKDSNEAIIISNPKETITFNATLKYRPKKSIRSTAYQTNSVIDLGGASLQIIAEISEEEAQLISKSNARIVNGNPEKQIPEVVHPVSFQGNFYILFVHSFLGYGYQTIRSAVTLSAINTQLGTSFCNVSKYQNSSELITGKTFPSIIVHPCIPEGIGYYNPNTFIVSTANSASAYITIKGSSEISWNACCASVASIFDLTTCEYPQCSFNNIPLPRSMLRKKNEVINLSSYFSTVLGPLLSLLPKYGGGSQFSLWDTFFSEKKNSMGNGPYSTHGHKDISLKDIERLGRIACSPFFTPMRYPDIFEVYPETSHSSLIENLCLDLSYIYTLMTEGFRIPKKGPGSVLRVEKEHIGNVFPCWTLGAAMHLFNTEHNL